MSSKITKSRAAPQQHRPITQVYATVSGTSTPPCSEAPPGALQQPVDTEALRLELLATLRAALGDDLSIIRADLQSVKALLASDKAASDAELATLQGTVQDMGQSLSTCSDDVVELKVKFDKLAAEFARLENKCEDLEARSRRNNIRIVGVSEEFSVSPSSVATMLKDTLKLDKEPLLDLAHRTSQPKPRAGERPRPIIARFHYYSARENVLQRARECRQSYAGSSKISVFPDHTARVARARAAFNEATKQLRSMEGVRYGLLYPARLRITYKGVDRDFVSAEDAMAHINKMRNGGCLLSCFIEFF